MKQYDAYINGTWVKPSSNHWFDTTYPYTGEVWAQVAHCSTEEVNAAVNAARQAFGSEWSRIKPSQRGRMLMKLADLVEQNAAHLAEFETRDNGKVYADNHMQIGAMAEYFRYYGGLADKIEGAVIPVSNANMLTYTRYEPFGVVAIITPWNSPLPLMSAKLAPALAAGNVTVIKPSSFTSVSTLEFMPLIEKAGFPAGVVNVVTGFGDDVGTPLVAHADVARIAFTGSEMAGQKINEAAAKSFKSVTLELGGKSPHIVFEDADLDAAASSVVGGIFRSTGQSCVAGSRLLLQRSIYDRFMERVLELARGFTVGDPMSPTTVIGPVATPPQYKKIMDYIDIAKKEGATCILGGGPYRGPGACGQQMVEPTIFVNVNNSMRIAQEEIFGPVLAVIPFDTEEEAIATANDIRFGLAAGIWTRDLGRATRFCERLQAGTVWVNTYKPMSHAVPSGGYKRSGVGRENGIDAIKEYLQVKSVWIAT
jgi:acyl-CoA reductase-like NAD-dependent aldehyde dehydrogenase